MARKRLGTGIPREWTPHTAEVLEDELTRIYSQFDQIPQSVVGLGSLALGPGGLIVGNPSGSGGFTSLPFDATPQRVLTNDGAGVPAWTQVNLTLGVTGTLPATNGGTGTNTVAVGDLLYGSATNVWSKLAKNTSATRYLSNTGAANIPAWAQVSLTTGVTGTLPVGNGGTGLATVAQGDLLYGSATAVLSALAKDTNATRYLSNTGATNNPAWAQVNLANGVTGTLPDGNLSANIPLLNALVNAFTQAMTIGGTLDVTGLYKAGGTNGVAAFGPAAVASITIKNGLVVAIA